ncbi:unnamed protein product [Merluccius merluccius]
MIDSSDITNQLQLSKQQQQQQLPSVSACQRVLLAVSSANAAATALFPQRSSCGALPSGRSYGLWLLG